MRRIESGEAAVAERAERGAPVVFSSHQLDLVERLCDSVAIINGGRLVARGAVSELGASGRALRVSVKSNSTGEQIRASSWAADLDSVEILEADDNGALLSLAQGADSQFVLEAARSAGNVEHFGFEKRTLAEVFRGAVEQ